MRHLICILQHHISCGASFYKTIQKHGEINRRPKQIEQNFFILETTDSPLRRPSRIPISNHPWQSSTNGLGPQLLSRQIRSRDHAVHQLNHLVMLENPWPSKILKAYVFLGKTPTSFTSFNRQKSQLPNPKKSTHYKS